MIRWKMETEKHTSLSLNWDTKANKIELPQTTNNGHISQNYLDWLISTEALKHPSNEIKCFKERFTIG